MELFDRDKPKSAQNFLSYVLSGAYSNSILHRASTNFVVQGGSLQIITFTGGNKSVAPVAERTNVVVNERGVGTVFNNAKGTLALAHYPGLTNESSCHWFINLADNAQLDVIDTNNAYTVFGRVIGGLDLLDKLNPSAANTTTKVLNLGGWLDEAPVRSSATLSGITYDDLLTTTWRIVALDMALTVEQLTNDVRKLTWLSVSNKTHRVEFAPTVTNSWTLLWSTNGNGGTQAFLHSSNTVTGFYRVNYQP